MNRRSLTAVLVLALLALLSAGCGDEEEEPAVPEKPAELVAVEDALLAILVERTDEDEGESLPEAVDCPADSDLEAVPAAFTCEITGSGETGEVEVTLRADGYDYTGIFGPSAFGGTGDGPITEQD